MINVWRSLRFTLVFAVLLGIVYPLFFVALGRIVFPWQAQGSLISVNGRTVGSELIAQPFPQPMWFEPRPSAVNYNADGSGGSNLGPTNPALVQEVRQNLRAVLRQNPGLKGDQVPTSMVESTGSGLDPDVELKDAYDQIPRISKATGLSEAWLRSLVQRDAAFPALGLYGEPMVNVMQLNLAIWEKLHPGARVGTAR
ncbi:potassium-transporting ATPase subunit KdpC [Alicyclobacillus acidocaldarius]|uniref:Potassium-transporting ATPase KdpC subunit n=2 Tax=Alicyclobacillus acidocaldarius subsp. acidocaldarius TaxID=1388 RepID=C8WRB0_ALIAD|nr:potassium-transporting ATPase subunit KdpC [Alicyclobacillus acidocaldarius]ACV57315.1 Potassium-transporting ATPase [Alicyclobacillus acidocaldarius subsp. acidocaldarius DSM 446]CAG29822.1 potassium-transporting ATPase C subunit [Alicyclobacillus acidocaldarius subsp. acidocaldarius DSM 446]